MSRFGTVCVLGILSWSLCCGVAVPRHTPAAVVTPVITALMARRGGAPGVAVVVRSGGTTQFFNFGWANVSRRQAVTPDAIFELASLTKVFTTTLLALAVQRHEVALDDSVTTGLPVLAAGGDIRRVDLEGLALHTSGLPRVPPRRSHPYTEAELLRYLQTWRRRGPPGPHYLYSNFGVGLLGIALVARTHQSLGQLYARRILQPLGMTSTFLEIPAADRGHLVQGYARQGGRPVPRTPVRAWAAAGSLCASARDMAAFLAANMNEGDAPPALRSAMHFAQQGRFRVNARFVQALGWQVVNLGDGLTCIDKNGGLPATSTYIGFLPDRRIGVVILCNRGGQRATKAGREILRQLAGVN